MWCSEASTGFGESGEFHASDLLRVMVDLPLVTEFFDTPDVVVAVLAVLKDRVPSGRIEESCSLAGGGVVLASLRRASIHPVRKAEICLYQPRSPWSAVAHGTDGMREGLA